MTSFRIRSLMTGAAVVLVAVVAFQVRGLKGTPVATSRAAPPLEGVTSDQQPFDLAALRGQPAVLVFYRGGYCGLCTHRLESLAAAAPGYRAAGARVVAVTLDPASAAGRTKRMLGLDFPVVSVTPETFRNWGGWGGGASHPRPVEVVLDDAGRIIFQHIGKNAGDHVGDIVLLGLVRDRLPAGSSR